LATVCPPQPWRDRRACTNGLTVLRPNAVLERDVDVLGHITNVARHAACHLRLTTNVSTCSTATSLLHHVPASTRQGRKTVVFLNPTQWVLLGLGFGVKRVFLKRPNLTGFGVFVGFKLLQVVTMSTVHNKIK